jgi:hypothetical protein
MLSCRVEDLGLRVEGLGFERGHCGAAKVRHTKVLTYVKYRHVIQAWVDKHSAENPKSYAITDTHPTDLKRRVNIVELLRETLPEPL